MEISKTVDDEIVSNELLSSKTIARCVTSCANSEDIYESGHVVQQYAENMAVLDRKCRETERTKHYSDIKHPNLENAIRSDYHEENIAITPESIIGYDDRKRVADTRLSPWSMICQLVIESEDGLVSFGTGWFISPCTVMTAGHCLYTHGNSSGWVKSIEVIPGADGHGRPFGSIVGTSFQSVRGWTERQQTSFDYGCIVLPKDTPLGYRTGWFGFARLSDESLQDKLVINGGYPGDKMHGTQWFDSDRLVDILPRQLKYRLDTTGGQSGSPIWRMASNECHAVGIHAYGGAKNKSTRINSPVFNNMLEWKRFGL